MTINIKATQAKKLAANNVAADLERMFKPNEQAFGKRERELEKRAGQFERLVDAAERKIERSKRGSPEHKAARAAKVKAEKQVAVIGRLLDKNERDFENRGCEIEAKLDHQEHIIDVCDRSLDKEKFRIQKIALLKAQKLLLSDGDGDKPSAKIIDQVIKQLTPFT